MSLKADSKYPSRLAYVVKFRGDTTPHTLIGRIENLVSGRQLEFASGSGLLDCLTRDLGELASEQRVVLTGDEK